MQKQYSNPAALQEYSNKGNALWQNGALICSTKYDNS